MSQNNTAEKAKMLAIIESINKINGFDPSVFAVDFTDLSTGEVRKRLPVMIQILGMLFVRNMTAEEIAKEWGCSVQYVYNQRSIALKELKRNLIKGE